MIGLLKTARSAVIDDLHACYLLLGIDTGRTGYRHSRSSDDDRLPWIHSTRAMHPRFEEKEREYWEAIISRHNRDPRKLWSTMNTLLGRSRSATSTAAPSFTDEE